MNNSKVWGLAVAQGLSAFALGFISIYLLKSGDANLTGALPFGDLVDSELPSTWKVVAWLFFGAHNVDIAASGLGQGGTFSVDQLPMWNSYLLVIPPVILVSSGYGYAQRAEVTSVTLPGTAGMVLGYLGLSLVAAFASAWSAPFGTGSLAPNPAEVVVFGSLYPLIFAPVGMFLRTLVADETDHTTGGQQPSSAMSGQPQPTQAGYGGRKAPAGQPDAPTQQPSEPPRDSRHRDRPPRESRPDERPPPTEPGEPPGSDGPRGRPDEERRAPVCPNCGAVLPEAPPTTCEECDTGVVSGR